MLEILKYFIFLNIDKQFLALISVVLWVMITIVAFLFFLSGVWIILFMDILVVSRFVILDKTQGHPWLQISNIKN